MSVSITIDANGLDEALARLRPIFDFDATELMTDIAALGVTQTQERIRFEKTSPAGEPWQANRTGTSILLRDGYLVGSVDGTGSADAAVWGAADQFAHVHQFGAVIKPVNAKALAVPMAAFGAGSGVRMVQSVTIPARPFVGLSDANRDEIIDLVTDALGVLP